MIKSHKFVITFFIMIFVLLSISCEWPFNTKPTEDDVFGLTINHSITRLMPSAEIYLTWDEITVEQFAMYKIERMRTYDTLWTPIVDLSNAFQLSYTDTIFDDENLIYRIGIIDLEDNVLWTTESISIPKTKVVYVPNEFHTIQPAFDSELIDDGDTIIVNPGIYPETLGIAGKDILIRSVEGFRTTILQPTFADPTIERVINVSSGILDGFTIELGEPSHGAAGGGVAMTQNGTVQNCYITTNQSAYGGGIFLTGDSNLYNNIIHNNIGANGSGMYITDAHGEIINNTIFQNDIVINGDCTGLIIRNNIIYQSQPDISYTNSAIQTGITIDFNLLDENIDVGSDHINVNPEFLDNIDFILSPTSPCIDAGHDGSQYNDADGSRNDIGSTGGPRARL